MRVTELDLSPAALACLLAADIADVDQLVTHMADELVRKGFGATELHEIVCQLKRNDLALMPTPMARVTYVPNERSSAVFRLRLVEGLTLGEIGERFGVSKELVRRILRKHFGLTGSPPAVKARRWAATETRRANDLARAQARADELIAAWRNGVDARHLAETFDLPWTSVEEVIQTTATDADRAARARVRSARRRPPGWRRLR